MSKKHHQLLAASLRSSRPSSNWTNKYQQWSQDVTAIATALSEDNSRFDSGKFFEACGYTTEAETSWDGRTGSNDRIMGDS